MLFASLLTACGLPSLDGRSESQALLSDASKETGLGKSLARQVNAHPGLSGVISLHEARGAFAARMHAISLAERSIDVQYYIWRDDITGNLLLKALQDAAQRGVRVRLLLDDNGVSGLDEKLALLNNEPRIEVRLFNPFPFRKFKALGFLTDFSRLNRRMHNKSLTVDGQITIVGGRNIGDEYFGANPGLAFADLDVMAAGAVVDDVSRDFDLYWNSQSAYPLEKLVSLPREQRLRQIEQALQSIALAPEAQAYIQAVIESRFIDELIEGNLTVLWVPARMVSDDPGKVLDEAPPEALLWGRLQQILDSPRHSVDLISPYFVPTQKGVEAFSRLAQNGVRVRILTNALEATDVTAVHAGYAKYRKPLLAHGIALYEMRRESRRPETREKAGPLGSSGSSLHAKTFAVDDRRVFVGSFNFDPRSARLNTELGFVLESPAMARAVTASFDAEIPVHAYELGLDESGDLYWLLRDSGTTQKLTREPAAAWWKLAYIRILSLLPIESML